MAYSGNKLVFQKSEEAKKAITDSAKKEISSLYSKWSDELGKKAEYYKTKTNSSAWLQEQNVRQLQAQLKESSEQINKELSGIIKNSIYLVSDSVVQANNDWLIKLGFPVTGVESAFSSVPDQTVRRLVTGQIYDTGWSLSKSIWGDSDKTMKELYTIVAQGLAQNLSVYDISKMLEGYVDPSRAKQWNLKMLDGVNIYRKSVDYNAQRLVRTLAQHGYQTSFIAVTENNPFVLDYIWRANGSRVCALCMDRDGQHFPKDNLPLDHPNGMCVMEPNVDSNISGKLSDWINSPDGTFPDIDAFANQFGYIPNVKNSVNKIGVEKSAPKKIVIDKAWIKKNCTSIKMAAGWKEVEGFGDVRKEITDRLAKDYVTDEYRQAFSKAVKKIKNNYVASEEGSYYNVGRKLINLSKYKAVDDRFSNKIGTVFHEFGHAIDDLAPGQSVYSNIPKYGFKEAMMNDLLNLENRLRTDKEFLADFKFDTLTDFDSARIQDILSATPNMWKTNFKPKGVSVLQNQENIDRICSIKNSYGLRTRFIHSDEYWQREDAVKEAASELFAHISAANVCEEEMEMMKQVFPESIKAFDAIIDHIVNKN